MFVLLTCVCCILVLLYHLHKWKYKDIDRLPGPPTLPILGSVLEYGSTTVDVLTNMKRLTEKYGGLVRMWIGLIPNVIITDVKYVEYFLSSTVHVDKTPSYDLFKSFLGSSMLVRPGDGKWKFLRKLLTPAFHFKILEKFADTFNDAALELIKNLEPVVDKEWVDIYPYVELYALDVLCQTSMGVQLNIQSDPNNKYLKAIEKYGKLFTERQFSLFKRNDYIFYFSGDYLEWRDCVDNLKQFSRKVIRDRREHKRVTTTTDEFGIKTRATFLDLLLEAGDEMDQLTDEDIRQEVDTVIYAGHETTSNATSLAIFELAKHMDVQEKILDESNEVLGEDESAHVSFRAIQSMKYLDLVCKECLRLYPGAPAFERHVTEDVELDGVRIPKGTFITIPIFVIHRSEKLFPDPEKFDPYRFLPENCALRNPFAYIPFSAGSRNCIGQRFAILQMKVILVKLIRNFKFYPVEPKHKLSLGANVVLKSVNGVPIKLKRRV